jgi:hypothetical protein
MKRTQVWVWAVVVAACCARSVHAEVPWEEVARADIAGRSLVVFSRLVNGSDIREVRGVGSFEAPSWIVKNVIDDVVHYKDFMPYTKVSDVLSRHDGYLVSYQRLQTPIVDDRDYTIKIYDESREALNGSVIWKNRWSEANKLGPPLPDGVVRVGINEGYWLLEDLDGGRRTKATYYVYTNPGGGLPAFIVNAANTQALPDLYKAVAKASGDPKYAKTRPTPRSSEKLPKATPPTLTPTTPTPLVLPPPPLPPVG